MFNLIDISCFFPRINSHPESIVTHSLGGSGLGLPLEAAGSLAFY